MNFEIKHSRPLISVQDMVNFIKKGEEYKEDVLRSDVELEEFKYLNAIILTPDYQRHYKSSIQEESSVIESLILGIPIPEVFLVKTSDAVQLRNVMDGQHRMNAIFRYVNDEFALKSLELLDKDETGERLENLHYEGKKFSELDSKDKIKILGSHISVLEFGVFENSDLEIELFKRYNRNSKPLEPQEISMATYFSKTSQFISKFINECYLNSQSPEYSKENGLVEYNESELKQFAKIYNITHKRKDKQKNHQEICIILFILENGPIFSADTKDGAKIATEYLRIKSESYKITKNEDIHETRDNFKNFNKMILKIASVVEFPFSSEIISSELSRHTKYHVGFSIVLATITYFFTINLEDPNLHSDIARIIKNSPLGDSEYRASSTHLKSLTKYLFETNRIQDETFSSLTIKQNKFDSFII